MFSATLMAVVAAISFGSLLYLTKLRSLNPKSIVHFSERLENTETFPCFRNEFLRSGRVCSVILTHLSLGKNHVL